MKRLYTLLYMVALATTVLAQNTTDAPNQRLRQLEESLQKQGYRVGFWQSNTYGHSIVRQWDIAMRVKGMPNTFKPMPDSMIAQRQERLEQALDAIRMAFADLSKEESTESQQYEYHKNGTDTVEYAMGFVNPGFKYKPTLNTGKRVFFANAYETADFYYNAKQYPLTFNNYDGTQISTQQVTLNANIYNYITGNIPDAPMEGATWLGWFTDAGHENQYNYSQQTKMPTGLVLYGNFQFPTRTVTFNSQGGTEVDAQTDEDGFYATKPEDPSKEYYTFQGWFTAADETGSPYDWNKPVTKDFTLYAHWTQHPITYTVHYYEKDTTNKVLDDKVVTDPKFTAGQTITEEALTVAGHIADNQTVTITLSFDEDANTIIFYYDVIPEELTYKVNYVLRDHPEIKVAESKEVTVPGTTANVMETAVEVDSAYFATQTSDPDILGKHYRPVQTSIAQKLGLENNVITFEYIPFTTTKITVHYLDMDGNQIHDTDTSYIEKGDTYTLQNKAPEGYVYHHANLDGTTTAPQKTYQITGTEGNLVINIYYLRKLIIIANNKSKTYDGTALFSSFANTADYTVTGLRSGDQLTALEFNGSQTDAGTSATTPKNAQITKGAEKDWLYTGILDFLDEELTIVVNGDCAITETGGDGIGSYQFDENWQMVPHDMTVKGDGKLTIKESTPMYGYGFYCTGALTLDGVDIAIESAATGVWAKELSIKNSSIDSDCSTGYSGIVVNNGEFRFENSTVNATSVQGAGLLLGNNVDPANLELVSGTLTLRGSVGIDCEENVNSTVTINGGKFDAAGTDTLFEYLPEDRFTLGENVAVTSGGFDQNNIVIEETVKPEIIIGDLNDDGIADVLDAVMIQKYAVDKIELTDEQKYVADVNGDGTVDILDAVMIQKYAVDKISGFTKES